MLSTGKIQQILEKYCSKSGLLPILTKYFFFSETANSYLSKSAGSVGHKKVSGVIQ